MNIIITASPTASPGHKICTRCNQEKPETEFHRQGNGSARRVAYCRDCAKAEKKARKGAAT